jgi:capsular polysaccharide export protein
MAYISKHLQASMFEQMLFPNDLEGVLMEMEFTPEMRQHAADIRQNILMNGLTRFNDSGAQWRRPVNVERVILVVGQVETDPSLKHGTQSIRTNLGLLKEVCQANSDAFIVYKPHPFVWAGMQKKAPDLRELQLWCDECVGDVALSHLLLKVNEVHVMTSLAGFEAVLRNKKVSCYGRPFYAGWGLTNDMVPMPNRPRQLDVVDLIAGAFFSFPRYIERLEGKRGGGVTPPTTIQYPWRTQRTSTLLAARA